MAARWKCTLCYDRLRDDMEPACAKACPTDSIKFGDLDELRERAPGPGRRSCTIAAARRQLYVEGTGEPARRGLHAFFLLLDEPEVYKLPPDPVVSTRSLPRMWKHAGLAAAGVGAMVLAAFAGSGTGRR